GKVTKTKSSKKDKKRPKHVIGAFFYFIAHERTLAKRQKIQLPPITEWTKAIAAKWRGLTPEEQHPFHEKAGQDKIRYKQELAKFNGNKYRSANNSPPPSGFLVFVDALRKGNHGDSKDIVKAATAAWNKMSSAKKRLYQQRGCEVRL
ncbi:hypothetical protein GH825_29225, partial [Bacillus thuringiensis]|nr:hypothetical protein [Bacillus thuringiensis]